MKRVKEVLALWFLALWLCVLPALASETASEPESLYAQSAVLMDADSGRILFEKNGEEIRANASTTKILTCILALEKGNLRDEVVFSSEAAAQPKVHLGAGAGRSFYLEDLLYSLMLESHNDSAVAVAEHIGGSTADFAAMMNEKAMELGCRNTHFVSPNGLDWADEGGAHSTTAADLARIMKYCIMESPKAEEFLTITRTANRSFSDIGGQGSYSCVNHNAFLSMMDGALTGKTGFTNQAGYCYVGALRENDRTFIIALLACGWPNNKNYKWSDARAMFGYGLAAYQYEDVGKTFDLDPVAVENGILPGQAIDEEAYVKLKEDGVCPVRLLLSGEDEVKVRVTIPAALKAPVEAGERVGEITYLLNGEVIRVFPVIAAFGAGEKDYRWCLERIWEKYLRL